MSNRHFSLSNHTPSECVRRRVVVKIIVPPLSAHTQNGRMDPAGGMHFFSPARFVRVRRTVGRSSYRPRRST